MLRCCSAAVFAALLPFGLPAQQLTFSRDIAPIVFHSCSPCHRPGEAAPFPLLTYSDVRKHAAQIVTVTHSGYMPPWLPQEGYGDFADSRRLSAAQIQTISDWVAQGAPEGERVDPPPQLHGEWQLGTPDLVLKGSESATVSDSGPDVYWNFIFAPGISRTRYVRAVEIRPGSQGVVHHANLMVDRTRSAPAKGFPGMDVVILRSPFDPDGHFLFWKPGNIARPEPPGFAWRLDPGDRLVLNTHLHPSGKQEEVRPSIGLYFTDEPQTQFPLLLQLEDDEDLDIAPGAADFIASDDFHLPMDVDVLAIYPHAHDLGNLLEAYATLPNGTRKWLIRIPHWDPAWQAVYDYREPVFLPKGSVLSMRYHYDNSVANLRNPNQPPRRVRAGDQSTDEMAHLWLQVLPRGTGDRRRELQEALMMHRLEKNPGDFRANFNLGAVMLSRLNAPGAVAMLEAAVRIDPARADAHNMLANALAKSGRLDEAIASFRQIREGDPNFAEVPKRLAQALAAHARQLQKEDRLAPAVSECEEAIKLDPNRAEAYATLGELLMLQGRLDDALTDLNKALELDPGNFEARDYRDILLHR